VDIPPSRAEAHVAFETPFPLPEPAFRYTNSRRLTAADGDAQAADYFAFLITRRPGDLLSHVHRISLHWHQRKGEQVFGALVDLFIALGPAGQSLRKRLLRQAMPVLKPTQQRLLHASMVFGLKATDALPEQPRDSVLLRGMLGGAPVVQLARQDTSIHSEDTLAEAQAFLEFGQVEEARDVLEHAVLREPQRSELQQHLLEIYTHALDYEALLSMRQRLLALGHEVGKDWVETEKALECLRQGHHPPPH
jgi:hypothetical protein